MRGLLNRECHMVILENETNNLPSSERSKGRAGNDGDQESEAEFTEYQHTLRRMRNRTKANVQGKSPAS